MLIFYNIKRPYILHGISPKICSPIFAVENFFRLLFRSAEIIRGDLSDFIYWLNFNILFYRADKAIPQKSLLLHTFL